jgi:hypothetical protein
MHLRHGRPLLHFLQDLGALYALRPTFMKSTLVMGGYVIKKRLAIIKNAVR